LEEAARAQRPFGGCQRSERPFFGDALEGVRWQTRQRWQIGDAHQQHQFLQTECECVGVSHTCPP